MFYFDVYILSTCSKFLLFTPTQTSFNFELSVTSAIFTEYHTMYIHFTYYKIKRF